jgi:thymidylate synthase
MSTLHPEGAFNHAYSELLESVWHYGVEETNARTGSKIRALAGGTSFKLPLGGVGRVPVPGNRRYFPHIAAAEVAWQFMGTKDPEFILKYAPKLWEKFVEDGELKSAYGYRWRRHFDRDQIFLAISELWTNPTNRQLYISAWDPKEDGLGNAGPKNIPCPVGFTLNRLGDTLHMSVFIRSSDVILGLPYDVMCYAMTLGAIANSVECDPGTLHVTLAHAHVYEAHYDIVKESMQTKWATPWQIEPLMPVISVENLLEDPHKYVADMKTVAGELHRHPYSPKPELIV